MTLFTTDYLEYYLTLLGWIIHNGIWAVLVSSGVFAIPFVAIIIQEWLGRVPRVRTKATRAHCLRCASRTASGWRSSW